MSAPVDLIPASIWDNPSVKALIASKNWEGLYHQLRCFSEDISPKTGGVVLPQPEWTKPIIGSVPQKKWQWFAQQHGHIGALKVSNATIVMLRDYLAFRTNEARLASERKTPETVKGWYALALKVEEDFETAERALQLLKERGWARLSTVISMMAERSPEARSGNLIDGISFGLQEGY